jgi:hypothetical protein
VVAQVVAVNRKVLVVLEILHLQAHLKVIMAAMDTLVLLLLAAVEVVQAPLVKMALVVGIMVVMVAQEQHQALLVLA